MKIILGQKKEMTQVFLKDGTVVPVTIIDVSDVYITGKKTAEKDGYNSIVLGKGKKKKFSKAEQGKYKELGFIPMYTKEARVDEDEAVKGVGEKVSVNLFSINDKIDITGITKGRGFQGVVKKWGFHGGPKTHGQSDRLRAIGSVSSGTTPGRVYKGKKMAGRMGGITKTVKNLKVIVIDEKNQLLGVKGAVPGKKDSLVYIKGKNNAG